MRWVNKLSDTDIEKLAKKLGIEYESLIIRKEINCIKVYLNGAYYYYFVIYDFSIMFSDDNGDYWECYDCIDKEKGKAADDWQTVSGTDLKQKGRRRKNGL